MPDAVNPDRNSLVYVYPGDDGPADGDTIQFNATTGRWEAVQGGTSGPDAWVLLESGNDVAQVLTLNTDHVSGFIEFDTQFQTGGTALTWDIGTPTIINAAAGWYTAYGTIFFHFANPGDAATALVFVSIGNGESSWREINPGAALPAVLNPTLGNTTEYSQDFRWPLWLLAANEAPGTVRLSLTIYGVTGDVTVDFTEFALIRTAAAPA